MTDKTPQQEIKAVLERAGLPYKTIEVYGSQIVVTCRSLDAADKWKNLLSKFATFRGLSHSVDYAKENKGTCLNPTTIEVWRAFACIV